MTPERARQLLPVFQAYAEGKRIQFRVNSAMGWTTLPGDFSFESTTGQYRVKPDTTVKYANVYQSEVGNYFQTFKEANERRAPTSCRTIQLSFEEDVLVAVELVKE